MTPDDIEDRLRRLGQAPIAAEVEAAHRQAIAQAASVRRPRFGWKAVAIAALAGFFVGSTGLAAAGSLPAPAQDAAHDVLAVVGIGVPRSTEDCPAGKTYRNHGEYVSAVEAAGGDVGAAARSSCGKPVSSGKGKAKGSAGDKGAAPGERPDGDGDACTGPPPWAGTHLDPEAKEAARADREATCGPDDDSDEVEDEPAEDEDPAAKSGPTTTTAPNETTTTAPAETTTTVAEGSTTTSTTQP